MGAWSGASSRSERHFRGGEADNAKSAGLPICTAGGCPILIRPRLLYTGPEARGYVPIEARGYGRDT